MTEKSGTHAAAAETGTAPYGSLNIELAPERYSLVRLAAGSEIPAWATGQFLSVIRSAEEVSVICRSSAVPDGAERLDDLRYLKAVGPFGLDSVGGIAAIAHPVASAGISLFLVSSWSTDHFFIVNEDLPRALNALAGAGHQVKAAASLD
jgi:hypothetical protein